MPVADAAKLATYDQRIAQTTTLGDFHRCVHCASWAHHLGHNSHDLHQRRLLLSVASWTNCLGALRPDKKVSDVELGWVDEAINTARTVGESSSWAGVPWEELIHDLIALDGIAIDDSTADRTIPGGWTCLLGMVDPSTASAYAEILTSHNIAVTRRSVPTSLYGLRQEPAQLLVRTDEAQKAHDILVEWSQDKPVPPST